MRLSAVVFALLALAFGGGCFGDDSSSARVEAYHLQTAWNRGEPAAEEPDTDGHVRVVQCGPPYAYCPGVAGKPRRTYFYEFAGAPSMTTADFDTGSARIDDDGFGRPVIVLALREKSQPRFHELTRDIAQAGRDGEFHQLALVVGDRLIAAPTIDYTVTPDGFPFGPLEIHGVPPAEAQKLVKELRGD